MSNDGGLWIKRSKRRPRTSRQRINQDAIRALSYIIVFAVGGIILISFTSIVLQADLLAGLFDGIEQNPDISPSVDEALSVLGNIAAAAVGGLVGWLTRDYASALDQTSDSEEPVTDEAPPAKDSEPPLEDVDG